jgi:ABC-2 type transport system permease protein
MTEYVKLEVRRALRDPGFIIMGFGMPVLMYLLFTNLGVGGDSQDVADYRSSYMVGMAAYAALGASMGIGTGVAEDKGHGWLRQLRVTPLSPFQVVLGRALTAGVTVLPAICAVLLAGALVNGIHLAVWQWAATALLLWVGTIPFTLLGLGNGYGLTGQTTGVISTACMMGLSIVGGLWIPVEAFPHWLAEVSRWTPAQRFGQLGWSVLDRRMPGAGTVSVLGGWLVVFAGYAVLSYRRGARTA